MLTWQHFLKIKYWNIHYSEIVNNKSEKSLEWNGRIWNSHIWNSQIRDSQYWNSQYWNSQNWEQTKIVEIEIFKFEIVEIENIPDAPRPRSVDTRAILPGLKADCIPQTPINNNYFITSMIIIKMSTNISQTISANIEYLSN